jgi:hypothetical protein
MQELLVQNDYQAFNQLNPKKDISNIFTPKKNVNKKFTEKSNMVRFGMIYISSSKKFCHLDKNKENYLIGIKPNFVYNVYDAEKNWKELITGKELMKKYNLVGFHYLTVEQQRFKNMQKANPFFLQFKNVQESMEWHRQQAKEQREQLNALLMNRKKNIDPKGSENDVISKFNSDYEQKKYQPTDNKRTVDINQLLTDLDDPMFS